MGEIIFNKSKSFEDLIVWQKAHQLVLEVYRITETFPKNEIYSLTSQYRRAAISIPANIAEGYKKRGKADKLRFFNISHGSLEEIKYYTILSKDLGYIDSLILISKIDEIGRLIESYSRSIREDIKSN